MYIYIYTYMVISFERNYIQEVITNSSPMHKRGFKISKCGLGAQSIRLNSISTATSQEKGVKYTTIP